MAVHSQGAFEHRRNTLRAASMPDDDEKSKIVQLPQAADAIKQLSIDPALVASIDKAAKAIDKIAKLNLPSARQMEVIAKAARVAPMHSSHLNSAAESIGRALATVQMESRIQDAVEAQRRMLSAIDFSAVERMRIASIEFENRFRAIHSVDITRWATVIEQFKTSTWANVQATAFETRLAAIRSPIIDMHNSLASFRGLGELASLGSAIRFARPYSEELTGVLRSELGDWRDLTVEDDRVGDDPIERAESYEAGGFNPDIVNFPADGFKEIIVATEIDLGTPALILPSPQACDVPEFNVHGYQWIYVLERELRTLILNQLSAKNPASWERRLPDGMIEKWREKHQSSGDPDQPLINFADFTDYEPIILKRDNWRECFKVIFLREEAVREAFNRLRPLRLMIAHMRALTSEEVLMLHLETRQLLRAVGFI